MDYAGNNKTQIWCECKLKASFLLKNRTKQYNKNCDKFIRTHGKIRGHVTYHELE